MTELLDQSSLKGEQMEKVTGEKDECCEKNILDN